MWKSGARRVARAEEGGAVAHRILPRGLHRSGGDRRHRLLQQEGRLRHPVPRQRRDAADDCGRSQTSRRRGGLLLFAAHLGAEPAASSPCALCCIRLRIIRRLRALGCLPTRLLAPRTRALAPVPPALSGSISESPQRRRTVLLFGFEGFVQASSFFRLSGSDRQYGMEALPQAALSLLVH